MKHNTVIIASAQVWQQKEQEQVKLSKAHRYAKYKEFRESICDLFDYQDFLYYAEETGLQVGTLRQMAKYSERHQQYMENYWSEQEVSHRQVMRTLFGY